MAEYRSYFCDARTGVLLEELPLAISSFSQAVNAAGTLTGTLTLGDKPFVDTSTGRVTLNWRTATPPKRTLLVVQRDQQIVWAGIVMKTRPGNDHHTVEVTAETLEGYWGRRRIKVDLVETAADVFQIVRDIVTQLQGVTGGNMRMAVTAGTAGQIATVTYQGKDRTKALDAWNALADVTPGFEYTISWSRSAGVFTPTLNLSAPGLANGVDGLLLEYPGNVTSLDYPEDGGSSPNALTGVGADAAGSPLMAEVVDTSGQLAAGYPIFEDEAQMREESDLTRIQARTTTLLNAGLNDYVIPVVELRGDADPHFGDFPLGVTARLRATSPYFPAGVDGRPGLDVQRRVTGWTVNVGPPEKVTLALSVMTGHIRPAVTQRGIPGYLAGLDKRLRRLETT